MEQTVFLGYAMLQLFGGCSHMAHVTRKAEDTVLQKTTLYYRLQSSQRPTFFGCTRQKSAGRMFKKCTYFIGP